MSLSFITSNQARHVLFLNQYADMHAIKIILIKAFLTILAVIGLF